MFYKDGESALSAKIFKVVGYAIWSGCIAGFFLVKEDWNQMFFFYECFIDLSFYTEYLVYSTSFGSEACLLVSEEVIVFKEPS